MKEYKHTPVMLEEVLAYLNPERPGIYIDCTFGLGGHSLEILKRFPQAEIIGFDLDEKALLEARSSLVPYSDRAELFHSDFRFIPELNIEFSSVRGILMDLGLSSFQLDNPQRGFSYSQEGPLDMRMDQRNKTTAEKILNKYSENNLAQLFKKYGELRQSRRLAESIVSMRKKKKFQTTSQLLKLTERICRWRPQKGKTHPASKVFQALRIEVNQELKNLAEFIEKMTHVLPAETRIVIISFHSLEDRIIKRTFNDLASSKENHVRQLTVLTKKPVTPSKEEITRNFRSRSAKLRVAETL